MLNKKSYLYSVLALSFVVFNTNVFAQDESDDDNVEEVVVTGSKISKDEFSSSSPITIITLRRYLKVLVMPVLMSILNILQHLLVIN